MTEMYNVQAITDKYSKGEQDGADGADEITQIIETTDRNHIVLKNYLRNEGNDYLRTADNNAEIKYEIIRNNVLAIAKDMRINNELTVKEYTCLVVQPIQNLQITAGEIITKISEKNETNIIKGRDISKSTMMISGIINVVIILTVIYFAITIVKNGKEMASRQYMAEKEASLSIKKAFTDNLTGLWNRKYIEQKVNEYIARGERGYLFMFDMDNFKSVNDTYGHIAGDNVLITFGNILTEVSREYDICCRAGGDEYMLFAKGIPPGKVQSMAERIIYRTTEQMKLVEGGQNVTISMGVAPISKQIRNFQELYDLADGLLYKVKNKGKNNYLIL